MNLAREDLERVGAKEGDEIDRAKWRILSRCGDPEKGEAERKSIFDMFLTGTLRLDVRQITLRPTEG